MIPDNLKNFVFQSLIWVACPTGGGNGDCTGRRPGLGFNPSYGLHALRALFRPLPSRKRYEFQSLIWVACPTGVNEEIVAKYLDLFQSLIWVACPTGESRPTGPSMSHQFQSLIWVACPTGGSLDSQEKWLLMFQSLIWVACPTGPAPPRPHDRVSPVSIPHMGCMPYGLARIGMKHSLNSSFNPSYGLHALRARVSAYCPSRYQCFNPSYGLHALRAATAPERACRCDRFQSLIWVACPTGLFFCHPPLAHHRFQSLIWVACPTGSG